MSKHYKIVLTGAESTGKSTLSEALAKHYNAVWIPEYAREYVSKLDHHYNYNDIVAIAKKQIEEEAAFAEKYPLTFFDTGLLITKVWFDFVFSSHPKWLDEHLKKNAVDLYLLCDIDMPWEYDPLRENGGANRKKLHDMYLSEMNNYGFNFLKVSGVGELRFKNAIDMVDSFLKKQELL